MYHNTQIQTIYTAIAIKPVWYWYKNIYEDQWSRIEEPDMNPSQLCPPNFLTKVPKYMMEKRQPLQLQERLLGKMDIWLKKTN
jgi:hypothetical protein